MTKLESTSAFIVIASIVVFLSILAFDHPLFAAITVTIGFSVAGMFCWYSITNMGEEDPKEFEND